MLGDAIGHQEIAARDGACDEEGAGLDTVGDDGVFGGVEAGYAADSNGGSAGAFDLRAHFGQKIREISNFGLSGGVLEPGLAVRQHRGHHEVLGAGNADPVEVAARAVQSGGGFGLDVAVLLANACAQLLEPTQVQVDGARADGAAAGQGNPGTAGAGQQRPQHQAGGAHGLHQLVGSLGRQDGPRLDRQHAGLQLQMGPDAAQQLPHGDDVAHRGDSVQGHRFLGQQAGGQGRQRRVLRATGRDLPAQRNAAPDDESIHS